MATVLLQKHLELRVGAQTVARFCCDDGSEIADPAIVLEILEEAQDIAEGILKKGFPDQTQRTQLLENDRAVRGAAIDVALGLMGRRRPEFLSADQKGQSPYDGWRRDGEKHLERVSTAEIRARGEEANGVGNNAHVAGEVSVKTPCALAS